MLQMNVAIPKLNNLVAPCFEAAREFEIADVRNGRLTKTNAIICPDEGGLKRIRLIRLHEINTVICSGIKDFYRVQLLTMGISVIPNINDSIEGALRRFLAGELPIYKNIPLETTSGLNVSHDDLVRWTKELFETNGYNLTHKLKQESFPIDIVAAIPCPQCRKIITLAICCGGQTYRTDQEIKEFHHLTKSQYNARVYVYPGNTQIARSCDEYGIKYLNPEVTNLRHGNREGLAIPIISGPIDGHEKLTIG